MRVKSPFLAPCPELAPLNVRGEGIMEIHWDTGDTGDNSCYTFVQKSEGKTSTTVMPRQAQASAGKWSRNQEGKGETSGHLELLKFPDSNLFPCGTWYSQKFKSFQSAVEFSHASTDNLVRRPSGSCLNQCSSITTPIRSRISKISIFMIASSLLLSLRK